MQKKVTVTYLEMNSIKNFRPKTLENPDLAVRRVGIPNPAVNHFFFVNVGRPFLWYSRLKWTYRDWENRISRENISTWIGYDKDSPVGYGELEKQASEVEISFFGLLPQFIGRGLGGWFLSEIILAGWALGAERIWLHTCTSDHRAALSNYINRGFTVYKEVKIIETIPDKENPVWGTPEYYRSLEQEFKTLRGDK